MSLVVSSTTDSQEAVDAAAGLEAGPDATAPVESTETPAESQPPQPITPAEPKEEEEEPDEQDDSGEPKEPAKKKGGFQRKIERLEREKGFYARRIEELESHLAGPQRPAGEPPKPLERPRQDQFTDYDEYVDKLTDWKIEQREAQRARAAQEWQAREQQRQQAEQWEERVGSFRETAEDFDEVLASVDRIPLIKDLQEALMTSENGPRLAYELARQPKELQRIAKLPPVAAVRELGKFEAKLSSNDSAGTKPVAHSQAPPPIRPVGSGGPTATKRPDEMDFQDYKAWHRQRYGRR